MLNYAVVGAGIVGLTVANELTRRHPDVGKHDSGRNSVVLCSGVLKVNTTFKAKVCSIGASRMRQIAAEHLIRCNRSGNVVIATTETDLPTVDTTTRTHT